MSERIDHFELEDRSQAEGRFGDHEHIVEILRSGEAHVIGTVDELYPDEIAAHQNVVEVVERLMPKYDERDASSNVTEPVMLHYGQESPLLCIFKPFDGENEKTKKDHEIPSFYPREVAGYLISEHFKFNFVPPTTVRELGGRIGALQLFLEPPQFISGEKFFADYTNEEWEMIQQSRDYATMAAFDYMLANTDRKDANFLVEVDEQRRLKTKSGQPNLVAIDHGLTLDSHTFKSVEIMGPILGLTFNNREGKPRKIELPHELHAQIADGLARRNELDLTFLPDIPQAEIADFWQRVSNLDRTGHFLSPENQKLFANK